MQLVESEHQARRRQLERVLESRLFTRSEQLSRLLRFLVEQCLAGRDRELKESVIGVEVFGRKPNYNPKFDPIVRTEARRLRARLSEYYQDEGKGDALVIELPKGGYVPVICSIAPGEARAQRVPRLKPALYWLCAGIGVGLVAFVLVIVGWARFVPVGRPRPGTMRSETHADTHELFLRARALEMLPALRGTEDSIDLFQHVIAKDPLFAPGYAGIAAAYAARSAFDRFDTVERAEMISKGWAAAEQAVQLDPLSADAQDGLGMMQAREAQWASAERSFRRAVEIAPRDPLWRNRFALFLLLPLGRIDEALSQLRTAEEIDPVSFQTHTALSLALRAAGRFDEAEAHCQKAAANDQERGACWSQTLLRQGDAQQAVRILEVTWSGHLLEPGAQSLGIAYARAGRRKDAERIAALVPRYASKAQIFAALGDKDRTFEVLDQMVPMGPTRIGRDVLLSPNFAFLRGDPRLRVLRKKVGLPEQR
jgi:tetratricopeptide (TPR) repeat protein